MNCLHPLGWGVQANGIQASLGEQTLYAQSYETVFVRDIDIEPVVGLCFMLWYAVAHITWQLEWAAQNMGMSHRRSCRRVLSLPNSPVQVRCLVQRCHMRSFIIKSLLLKKKQSELFSE